MPYTQVEQSLKRLSAWVTFGLAFIVVFAICTMAILAWLTYRLQTNAHDLQAVAVQTHEALCTFRKDLEGRYDQNAELLKQPGDPIIVYGISIPRASLTTTVLGQRATLTSLDGLKCEGADPK